jgi:Sulfotransferase domain
MIMKLALLYGVGIAGLRRDDIWLASFPRSGSTWVRYILCNYIAAQDLEGIEMDLVLLDEMMPALGRSNLLEAWPYTTPRFVKTHLKNSVLLSRPQRSVQIVRDPRDVMVSYFHHLRSHSWIEVAEDFGAFLKHPKFGLQAYFTHYQSWQKRDPFNVYYEDLKADAPAVVGHMLAALDMPADSLALHQAVERSSLHAMQKVERSSGISGPSRFSKEFQFVRKGTSRQWPDYFSDDDLAYYQALCEEYEFRKYTN